MDNQFFFFWILLAKAKIGLNPNCTNLILDHLNWAVQMTQIKIILKKFVNLLQNMIFQIYQKHDFIFWRKMILQICQNIWFYDFGEQYDFVI